MNDSRASQRTLSGTFSSLIKQFLVGSAEGDLAMKITEHSFGDYHENTISLRVGD